MSLIDTACQRIVENPRFEADFDAIARQSILESAGLPNSEQLEEEVLRRLMQSAALLAQSAVPEWRQLAYRISVGSLAYREALGGIAEAARLTLARLGNFPAIHFAFKGTERPRTLPRSLFYEISRRQDQNSISIGERQSVLTDMQKQVWDVVAEGGSLALSAPTSAGKSFVFKAYLENLKRTKPQCQIVYLVPSRALISQVSSELRESGPDRAFGVVTVPLKPNNSDGGTPIYVLTPERLQVLLQSETEMYFDVAIVDEAHLIADGSRGIVLHSVLQDLRRRNREIQFLFSSPQVREPRLFGSMLGIDLLEVVKATDSPVAQNIILLQGDALDPQRITISLWRGDNQSPLTQIEAATAVYNSYDRLIYSAWALGASSQSLVYAQGPAQCEDIAFKLKNLAHDESVSVRIARMTPSAETIEARENLSRFAKEAVHSTYVLAETVLDGIGFHYGRIPALLRNAVEDAFSEGHLDYIVCTSTLLQGVNLPARNVFMHNPHKGEEQPITPVDFWNLAGRAGRLGKDFQGNVFLVDYDGWDSTPLTGPKDEIIKPALEVALVDDSAELLEYIDSPDEASGARPILEAAFSKLLRDFRDEGLQETLDQLPSMPNTTRVQLEEAIEKASSTLSITSETLKSSPQISGYRQQQLYDYMINKIKEKGPEYLIPLHPSADFRQALDKLRPVFARVHKYLELNSGMTHRYWAPLALRWMRGEPLPSIIDDAISYHKKQGRRRNNRTIIREVLTDIESGLRFRYVNLLGCYIAVLKQALNDMNYENYVARVPALTLYLELGAASQTMIHLMSMGLSRHTSSRVANLTINREMDATAAREFLRRLNPQTSGLSPYVANEIARALAA